MASKQQEIPTIYLNAEDDLAMSLDRQIKAQSPPLDRLESHSPSPTIESMNSISSRKTITPGKPSQQSSLFVLLTCPDMAEYLIRYDLSEEMYTLPLPLSTLLIEAKEEVIANQQMPCKRLSARYSALQRLHTLRDYLWAASGHDISNMMPILEVLINNEDQLQNIIHPSV
ncbi:uncharacterized protein BX664DRAFT_337424 [Halteromyces radiatus]|uniref:uncharacterized protein n=1 Tax=Halteromyces radiatus TaxID=101107 RepID=UPI0022201C26|nr:uncharacterized protein BX664DRAFT_337424 [Halteromyces radiatus]KAI8084624.1 hypothetical protein BX664DRAFT_337424 [Halteromyces radiatus]